MDITRVAQGLVPQVADGLKPQEAGGGEGFAAFLEKSIGEVNELLRQSDQSARELAVGKTENLHEAMIGFEKAETALKLLVQVRNKALEAYNQILSMQV